MPGQADPKLISKIQLGYETYDIADALARQFMTKGVRFLGVSSTEITEGGKEMPTIGGSTVWEADLNAGDMVFYTPEGKSTREFIWEVTTDEGGHTSGKWREFGRAFEDLGQFAFVDEGTVTGTASGTVVVADADVTGNVTVPAVDANVTGTVDIPAQEFMLISTLDQESCQFGGYAYLDVTATGSAPGPDITVSTTDNKDVYTAEVETNSDGEYTNTLVLTAIDVTAEAAAITINSEGTAQGNIATGSSKDIEVSGLVQVPAQADIALKNGKATQAAAEVALTGGKAAGQTITPTAFTVTGKATPKAKA